MNSYSDEEQVIKTLTQDTEKEKYSTIIYKSYRTFP